MIRTQVYLTPDLYNQLIFYARAQKQPVAKVLRLALSKGIKEFPTNKNDLLSLTRLKIKGGPKNLSGDLDKYLYG